MTEKRHRNRPAITVTLTRDNVRWVGSREGLPASRVVDLAISAFRHWYEGMTEVADSAVRAPRDRK